MGSTWRRKTFVYVTSAAVAGASFGSILGWLGGEVTGDDRVVLTTVVLLAGSLPAALEVLGRKLRPPELDVETPQAWVNHGPLLWAARNGAALGIGILSRIGFWLWYVVPASAFLSGRPWFGTIVYGLYALFRAAPAWAVVWATSRGRLATGDPGEVMMSFRPVADRLSAATLWVVIASGFVAVAL